MDILRDETQRSSLSPWTVGGRGTFPRTQWTLVVAAGDKQTEPEARAALERLCRGYWFPVYVYIRRRGKSTEEAQDLTQEFFLRILSGTFFARASREKGRFRSFMLGAVKNFLADSHDHDTSLKRGGGLADLPFDFDAGESTYVREPRHDDTPERIFERKWAWTLLDRVVEDLQNQACEEGTAAQFNRLKIYLTGSSEVKYAAAAAELGLSEAAAKSAIQRLRRRYRDLVRAEVAATVAEPAEVDEELRFLLQAISTRMTKE